MYLVAMVTSLQWQSKRYLYNSFILSTVELISSIMFQDKKNQLHKSLLRQLNCHGNHKDTSITFLSQVV